MRLRPPAAAAETWFDDFDASAGRVVPLIKGLKGWRVIEGGDWIVTGVAGERYPMKDGIFQMTYEPVDREKKNISARTPSYAASSTKAASSSSLSDLSRESK